MLPFQYFMLIFLQTRLQSYEQKGEEAIYGCCIPAAIEMALEEVWISQMD